MALVFVVLPFLGTVLAMVLLWNQYVFAQDIVLMLLFTLLTGIGVTIGYHRMLTHQGFQTSPVVRGILLILGCMAMEGAPIGWSGMHIKHHAFSDQEGDPHSPLHGFWHAHLGWVFTDAESKAADKYAPHLQSDPVAVFVERTQVLWMALSLLLPGFLGGWTGLLWGGVVRMFITQHVTWSVNSVCHTFGKRAFETNDESRNNWIVGLLAFGEGWHNNHHAFPSNAFHGMRWWQFDLSGFIIRGLEKAGLVWDVQRVSLEAADAQRTRMQAMREGLDDLRKSVLSSLVAMRKEIAGLGDRMLPEELFTDAQWAQAIAFQQEALRRLDDMRQAVIRSQNLKRQRMLHYQREAQKMLQEVKMKWVVTTGRTSAA